ncbi:MAG: prepilin-type N-terminal cleavage/methylation domain-containing protein [Planctomycetota bacterium]
MRKSGFTLIELMIVVAVIAIIAAISIPYIVGARMSSNEASAINSLRTLTTANNQYRTRFNEYAGAISDLEATNYIDASLGTPPYEKAGYSFTYSVPVPLAQWECEAIPLSVGSSGDRGFFVDESGVIRFTPDGSIPDETSAPVD